MERSVNPAKPNTFRTGDVVRLKSGGPSMTVESVDADFRIAECGWFWRATYRARKFAFDEIEPVSDGYDPLTYWGRATRARSNGAGTALSPHAQKTRKMETG